MRSARGSGVYADVYARHLFQLCKMDVTATRIRESLTREYRALGILYYVVPR